MVFMLRLIPGIFLFVIIGATESNTTTLRTVIRKITDEDVENAVRPFKFSKKNLPTLKLEQSESYTTEKSRTGSGRSVDIDVEKYISPDFHNAVYTNTKQEKSYSSDSTEDSLENIDRLTTPKTPYVDQKFRNLMKSVNDEFKNITFPSTTSSNFVEDSDKNNTRVFYRSRSNETTTGNKSRGRVIQESHTTLNVEHRVNTTKTYEEKFPTAESNELEKETIKFLLGNQNANEVRKVETTTTRRNTITKPTTQRTDSAIINNKIENETVKAIPATTVPSFSRGSIKYADYQKSLTSTPSPTSPSVRNNILLEQAVQENQILPVHVTPPITIIKSTDLLENATEITSTKMEETAEPEPEEQQSTTVFIFVQTEETTMKENNIPMIASTPTPFTAATTELDDTTTIATITQEVTTIETPTTVEIEKITTPPTTVEIEKITTPPTTVEIKKITTPPTTTEVEKITTPPTTAEIEKTTTPPTTTEIETTTLIEPTTSYQTTINPVRSSKEIKYSDITQITSTESTKTTKSIDTTTIPPVTIEVTHTRTLLDNKPTTIDDLVTTTTTTTTTTESSISFVHIKNIDANHTTLLPDILKPNEVYTTENVPRGITDETTYAPIDGPGGSNGAVVAIVIFCVGGICLIVLAFLLIVMRNRQKRFNYGQRCRPVSLDDYSVDNVSVFNSVRRKAVRDSKRSYGNPAFEDPAYVSHPLNFPAISKFVANEEDVYAEYRDIPQIIARTSELPDGCETKNRYANVIPLPESRVFLKTVDGYPNSDYINANYVSGPKGVRNYYIACQAPMSNTVDDFWRMIWEQQCKVILMLTHLFENGVEKCFDYLPPSEVTDCHRLFGDFQVTLKKREVKEKYIISSIQLKNMVTNSWREVTHFWYMGWPEKGVPTEANSMIAFLIEARSYMKTVTIDKKTVSNGAMNGSNPEVNPVVIHCSPGTGRTGTVIACDIAIRDFEQTRQIDIPKIVYRIRRDRASAVQTREQYAFIYKVIDFYATKLSGGLESI